MPDRNKERFPGIEGETYETTDNAIEARIVQLRQEIGGLSSPSVVIEGQTLAPKVVGQNISEEAIPARVVKINTNNNPGDSATGLHVWHERQAKKAA